MRVSRGVRGDSTRGDREIVYCEARSSGLDVSFYKSLLSKYIDNYEFKPYGSCNTLLALGQGSVVEGGFCLIDRDFRTTDDVAKIENDHNSIRFLGVHEAEYFLLDTDYLLRLDYIKDGITKEIIKDKIDEIIEDKKIKFLADFLQFRINSHIDRFPRIRKIRNSELPPTIDTLRELICDRLDTNYQNVNSKKVDILDTLLDEWIEEYDTLDLLQLPSKEIFKTLKGSIFQNPPLDSDIAKDIATLMEQDNYIPTQIKEAFRIH